MLITVGVASYAWFSTDSRVGQSGTEITVSSGIIDFVIVRDLDPEYEKVDGETGDPLYEGVTGENGLQAKLSQMNFSLTATDTIAAPKLAYELYNEYLFDGLRNMQPGAYGTVTFYIRPKPDKDGETVTFSIERGCFANVIEDGDPVVTEVTNANVINLLRGHVLFFSERTGVGYANYVYDGLIDNTFEYDMSAHSKSTDPGKTDCYKVVLYWEWPEIYADIVNNISTESPAVTRRFPSELGTYLSNGQYFFKGAYSDDLESKSDAYNDGDQAIGDAADYFVLYITAQ